MKILYTYITLVLFLYVTNLQAQTVLDGYLKIGAENNAGLKSKFAEYNAALEKIPQVGSLPDPSLSFGYFISPIETRLGPQQAKLGISQMFPWFGTLKAKKDVAIQMAKAKYEAFEDAKSMLFFEIKSAYYNVYIAKKGIDITQENIRILNTFQQLALIKIETGKSSVVDEMRVEMEINELKNQLAYLEDKKLVLEVKFKTLLNSPNHSSLQVPDTLWSDSLSFSKNELLDSVFARNHFIKQLDHRLLSFESLVVVEKKMGLPQFSVGVDYSFIGKSENPNLGVGNGRDALLLPKVGISIPLYRNKYKAMVKEASFNMEAAQHKKEDRKNKLTVLLENGFKDYKDANRRVHLFQLQSKLAEKSLNILLSSYASDGQNFEEVLRMERKILKYRLELDKARADKNAAVAFINYLIGN